MRKPIIIIQGDTFDLDIHLYDYLTPDVQVNRIVFVCKSLKIEKDFIEASWTEDSDLWFFSLSAEETAKLRVGTFTFDITAYLEDGDEINTLYHNQSLEVIFKANKCQN